MHHSFLVSFTFDVRILICQNGALTEFDDLQYCTADGGGEAFARRHQELFMGAARMDDHNGRTSPAKCCTSVTDSFQDGYSACYVQHLLFPCIALARACINAMLQWSVRVPSLRLPSHALGTTVTAKECVCLSVTSNTNARTVTRGDMTANPVARSRRHASYLRHLPFPREGERVNRVWSALLIRLICRKWANRKQHRGTADSDDKGDDCA